MDDLKFVPLASIPDGGPNRRRADHESFKRNMSIASNAIHASRCYAKGGHWRAVWNCVMLAALHRNIAKQFLRPEWPGAWGEDRLPRGFP